MPNPAFRSALVLLAMTAAAAGCARALRGGSSRPLALGEFAAAEPSPPPATDGAERAADPDRPRALPGALDDEPETDRNPPASVQPGAPDREALRPTRPGDRVVVDSLVGHVNGRPIFADEFLSPLEDRLLRAAEESSGMELERRFREIIGVTLRDVIQNELMLSQAEASLSEQEQRGLFAWLRQVYNEEIRLGGGTRSGAERRRRESGEELEEYIGKQKDTLLLRQLIAQKVRPRVIVSWRDIEREYRRRYDEFNRPATVTLGRIRLNHQRRPELVDEVTRRLESGEPFAEVAGDLGFRDGGRWQTFDMGPDGVADIAVSPVMRSALEGLEEGDTTPPLRFGPGTVWLHVVSVDRPESRSIYDPEVQLALREDVTSRRFSEEVERYVASLLEQGIYDDLDAMALRLYRIALLRYAVR